MTDENKTQINQEKTKRNLLEWTLNEVKKIPDGKVEITHDKHTSTLVYDWNFLEHEGNLRFYVQESSGEGISYILYKLVIERTNLPSRHYCAVHLDEERILWEEIPELSIAKVYLEMLKKRKKENFKIDSVYGGNLEQILEEIGGRK